LRRGILGYRFSCCKILPHGVSGLLFSFLRPEEGVKGLGGKTYLVFTARLEGEMKRFKDQMSVERKEMV